MEQPALNDGIVNIYKVGNIAEAGNKPKDGLTIKVGPLRFEERTVGMGRFWAAAQSNVSIDMVIRVAKLINVTTQDVAIYNEKQYDIIQIQYPKGTDYPKMDLSLRRREVGYDVR